MPERHALAQALSNPACTACHSVVDPFGFALLHFDAMGAYRDVDHGEAIDASGSLQLPGGPLFAFDDIRSLTLQLAPSCEAAKGLLNATLPLAIERRNGATPYDDQGSDRARLQNAFFRGPDRSYGALVVALSQTATVLSP